MKNRVCIVVFVLLQLLLLLATSAQATRRCGIIASDETWTKNGNPWIVCCNTTVVSGVTLRIEPGTRIYFCANVRMIINGTIKAIGTNAENIYFTSARDTSGGSGGAPGDWRAMEINGSSVNDSLAYCTIQYGGRYYSVGYHSVPVIDISGASPLFESCAVYNNYDVAFKCCGGTPKIYDCKVYDNGGDAYWVCDLGYLPDIRFSGPMNPYVYNNHGNGIRYDGGTLGQDVVVPDMGPCYWLRGADLTVAPGYRLTLEPGVIWKINPNLRIIVNGTLKAVASSSEPPIILTSYQDDERQDTNGDGNSNGAAGDWRSMEINGSSVNDSLAYCVIRYGGRYYSVGYHSVPVIDISGASPLFESCEVYNNYDVAFKCCGGTPKIYDCKVYDNGGDAYWVCDLGYLPDIRFSGPMNPYVYNNHGNGIRYDGGTLGQDVVVPNMGPCYWLKDMDLTVAPGYELTLEPGVIWKIDPNLRIIVNGTLRAIGTSPERILVTSYRDDERQDTNGDGNSNGAAGDWRSMEINGSSVNDSLAYCVIRYGGRYYSVGYHLVPMVDISGASPGMRGCWFSDATNLMRTSSGANPLILKCAFFGERATNGLINSDSTITVRAEHCWWGDPSGPYDPSTGRPCYNPAGLGCFVSDYVDYCPWEIVATLLQAFEANFVSDGVHVEWTLSEVSPGAEFVVLRAQEPYNNFKELPSSEMSQEGLSFTFVDKDYEPGESYRYRVDVYEDGRRKNLFETDAVSIPAMPLTLGQNYPNPFNPSTVIQYYLPEACKVSLRVYDVAGREISCLVDREQTKGKHQIDWKGVDARGNPVGSGVYFYRFTAGKESVVKKMILLR